MKRLFFLVLFITFAAFIFSQEQKIINDGFLKITEKEFDGIHLSFTEPILAFNLKETPNGNFLEIASNDLYNSFQKGEPNIPVASYLFEIPLDAEISIETIGYKEVEIDLSQKFGAFKVIPAQPSISKSDERKDTPFYIDESTYKKDKFINNEIVVYDNNVETVSIDADPETGIAGGQIVIHSN